VLVIGRADMNKLEKHPARLDMGKYCRDLCDTVQPTLGKRHELQVKIADDFGDAFVDVKLLNHILTNLLSNAVKYSPEGGTVMFEATREGGDAIFVVADQGIGIREADLERLFESFHRGSNVGVISGTGLGLAVVKRSVVAHGGSLDVKTKEGEGTTFTVRVHIAGPDDDESSIPAPRDSSPTSASPADSAGTTPSS
jgi:signal transduction histidine kinase